MAEEREEKKKPGIVRRIFKWIGLGLLTLLIVLGLIFQAPWKVTTLLAIILLACTILPKQLRKWFWAGVGAVVIALIVWVFLPDRNGGWRSYTFDEELAAIKAKRAIPDEENAAIIYNQLFESLDTDSNQPEFFSKSTREPWRAKDHPELAQWLKQQQNTIEISLQISQYEKCRFPIYVSPLDLGKHMPPLSHMRKWAYLLMSSANNDIAESHPDKAFEKVKTVLQMAKHQFQQPTMIDTLVGIALEALAIRQFNTFVVDGDATESHLSVIEKALAEIKHDWSYDLPRILKCEKLIMKNFLGMFYEVNSKGKVRFSRDPYEAMRTRLKEQLEADQVEDEETRELLEESIYLTYWQKKLFKASAILGWFFMPSTPEKAGRIIDESYKKYYAMAEPDYDWQKEREKPSKMFQLNYQYLVEYSTEILAPAYHRVHDIYLRLLTDKRGSEILIALRRYKNKNGYWPVNLDDVKPMAPVEIFVDPTNGGDFVYEITEENFRLYSKGKNNVDEDGKYKRRYGETSEGDDWLIWPPRSRKAKEEGTNAEQQ